MSIAEKVQDERFPKRYSCWNNPLGPSLAEHALRLDLRLIYGCFPTPQVSMCLPRYGQITRMWAQHYCDYEKLPDESRIGQRKRS